MYINLLFIIIALIIIFYIAKQRELSKSVKITVISLMALSVALASLYEYGNKKIERQYNQIALTFKKGQKISCKKKSIDNTTYYYEPGTASFIPKAGVVGETFHVSECIALDG
jgi:uncharacterized membrane protein YfbV (UPF0208 family)